MCPGLCSGPKANWHGKAYLHAIELSLSPEQQGHIQPTSWELALAGSDSSAVPGIVWESISWHQARPCQRPFEQLTAQTCKCQGLAPFPVTARFINIK